MRSGSEMAAGFRTASARIAAIEAYGRGSDTPRSSTQA
jgi:hypothetical protein